MRMRLDLKQNPWVWQVTSLSVVLGMLLGAALKTQTSIRSNTNIPTTRFQGLAQAFLDEKDENKHLHGEITKLREQVNSYEEAKGADGFKTQLVKKELEKTKLLAGLMPAQGPGLEVTLQDSRRRPSRDMPLEIVQYYNIHDSDLRDFVHLLFANGAEAISIKDRDSEQRVILTTGIICTNGTIKVDGVRMGSPFTIRAIGPPDVLEQALKMSGGFMEKWREGLLTPDVVDSMVRLESVKNMTLPAYSGNTQFIFAHNLKARE